MSTLQLLAQTLRERPAPVPPRHTWPDLIAAARDHGVLPLLASSATAGAWDRDFLREVQPEVAAETALSIVRERELARVLAALAARGVTPLLLKGAHLAFTVYPSPDRRPRLDTDLLIKEEDREPLRGCLLEAGYQPVPHVTGDVAFRQCQYERTDHCGAIHIVDVHWRIANPRAFADRMGYDDLVAGAVRIPRLSPFARAPRTAFALLLACVHRTAHHRTSRRLVWLYDIHLLASELDERDWDDVTGMAVHRGLSVVLSAGLLDTRDLLATAVPSRVLQTLAGHQAGADPDILTFLEGASMRQVMASDWQRLAGWRDRVSFLREHLFPPAAYMSAKYGSAGYVTLPFLYARRIIIGAWRERHRRASDFAGRGDRGKDSR